MASPATAPQIPSGLPMQLAVEYEAALAVRLLAVLVDKCPANRLLLAGWLMLRAIPAVFTITRLDLLAEQVGPLAQAIVRDLRR